MVSVANEEDEIGPTSRPLSPASGTGLPVAMTGLTRMAHFNDLGSVERILAEYPGQVAGAILEPIMMNAGIIPPEEGVLRTRCYVRGATRLGELPRRAEACRVACPCRRASDHDRR